jgi:hypothetical protein
MKKQLLTALLFAITLNGIAQSKPKPGAKPPTFTPKPGKVGATNKSAPIKNTPTPNKNEGKTIKFRDNKTYTIKGQEIAGYTDYSDNKPSKKNTFYYLRNGNNITITKLIMWIEQKTMDELRVYKFSALDLYTDGFGELGINEISEDQKEATFSLNVNAAEGKEIKYDVYSSWSAKPEARTFNYFTFESTDKAILEKVVADIKTVLPKVVEAE